LSDPAADEPRPPYPAEYLAGIALFNARAFWEAHEALEALWLPLEGDAGPRLFYQGLIQAAAAFHQVTHTGRWHGAVRNLDDALAKLERYRPRYGGVDVEALCERLARAREACTAARFEEALFFEIEVGEG
jgi:predicted metal-dependent hydrolase